MKLESYAEVVERSMNIDPNITIIDPRYSEDSPFYRANIINGNIPDKKTYSIHSGVVAYIDENGKYNITPYREGVEGILRASGYVDTGFLVPLDNGKRIVNNDSYARRWDFLVRTAELEKRNYMGANAEFDDMQRREILPYNLAVIAQKRGIGELPSEIFDLMIDIDSLSYKEKDGEVKQLPTTLMTYDENTMSSNIGTFNSNNGVISFISKDGKTYVGPELEGLADIIKGAGYTEDPELVVPLSNGETIVNDAVIKNRYEALSELKRREDPENKDVEAVYIQISPEYEKEILRRKKLYETLTTKKRELAISGEYLKRSAAIASYFEDQLNLIRNRMGNKRIMLSNSFKPVPDSEALEFNGPVSIPSFNIEDGKPESGLPSVFYDLTIETKGLKSQDPSSGEITDVPETLYKVDESTKKSNGKTWNYSGGVIVVIGEDGKTYMGPAQSKLFQTLDRSGYTEDPTIAFQFAKGEILIAEEPVKRKFDQLKAITRRKNNDPTIESSYIRLSPEFRSLESKNNEIGSQIKETTSQIEKIDKETKEQNMKSSRLQMALENVKEVISNRNVVTAQSLNDAMTTYEDESYLDQPEHERSSI